MKILKKIISIVVLAVGISTTSAQVVPSKDSKIGVKGGFNMSNLYTEDVDDENVLFGVNLGLFAELPLISDISLQPEILFSSKGAELKYDNAFATGTAKFRLNYIEVPLLLKLNVTKSFNVHFGPYAAFLIDSKITNEDANGSVNFEQEVSNDDLNKFDYGLAGGIGFDFGAFGIGARYNHGLNTVGKERTFFGQTYTFPDSKNSVLSVYGSIKF